MIRTVRMMSAAFAVLAALAVMPGRAAVIAYVEGPDLGTQNSLTNLGALDIGTNTVTGGVVCQVFITGNPCSGDFVDAFVVSLASGLNLTSISAAISAFQAPVGTFNNVLSATSLPIQFGNNINGNGVVNAFAGAAAGPGTIGMQLLVVADPTTPPGSYSFNYTVSMVVANAATIPEPATLALLGLGLAGLGFARRKEPN